MLRQAINNGYDEGFRAGQADRQDGWGFSPQDAIGYEDASYGYDGYYSRNQYGRYSNGSASILGTILETILNLQQIN